MLCFKIVVLKRQKLQSKLQEDIFIQLVSQIKQSLCIKNFFHGRTIAAIFASGSKKMTEGFGPKVNGFDHFDFGDHKTLEKVVNKNTAAVMVETIMGEGGIKVIPVGV